MLLLLKSSPTCPRCVPYASRVQGIPGMGKQPAPELWVQGCRCGGAGVGVRVWVRPGYPEVYQRCCLELVLYLGVSGIPLLQCNRCTISATHVHPSARPP